jgi:hypothetical protein
MDDDNAKDKPPKWQSVKHRVLQIPLQDCPFNRPGLKQAIGMGNMWELEFEDGHTETVYEGDDEKANERVAEKPLE